MTGNDCGYQITFAKITRSKEQLKVIFETVDFFPNEFQITSNYVKLTSNLTHLLVLPLRV